MSEFGGFGGVPPGLQGFLMTRQLNEQSSANNLSNAVHGVGLVSALRSQKEDQDIREILSNAPSIEAAFPALLKSGPKGMAVAHQFAQLGILSRNQAMKEGWAQQAGIPMPPSGVGAGGIPPLNFGGQAPVPQVPAGAPTPAMPQVPAQMPPPQAPAAPMPQPGGTIPQPVGADAPQQNLISQLPPEIRNAVGADIAFNDGKNMGTLLKNAGIIEIPNVGAVKFDPMTKQYKPLEGLTDAMRQWEQGKADVAAGNEIITVPSSNPKEPPRQMTKKQRLDELRGEATTDKSGILKVTAPDDATAKAWTAAFDKQGKKVEVTVAKNAAGMSPDVEADVKANSAGKTKLAEQGAEFGKTLSDDAAHAVQTQQLLAQMSDLGKDFTQGKMSGIRQAVAQWKIAAGIGTEEDRKWAAATTGVDKLTAQLATATMKTFTNRGTQMEFKTFLQNNPNKEMTPEAFKNLVEFMGGQAQKVLDKQSAFSKWSSENPLQDWAKFDTEWNQRAAPRDTSTKFDALPPAQQFRGQSLRDTTTGKVMKSDGLKWVPQ